MHKKQVNTLNDILGLQLESEIATQALTHRSMKNKVVSGISTKAKDNERLEFLGDAVLELIVTTYLYHKYTQKTEGELTSLRSAMVKTDSLAQESKRLGFDKLIIMSTGEETSGGRMNNYLLANTFEAIIGAIYVCFGYEAAKDFVTRELIYKLEYIISTRSHKNAKTDVQEIIQEICKITPVYKLEGETGPDHNKQFRMSLYIGSVAFTQGVGNSKQRAELNAATKFLEKREENIAILKKSL